MKQLNATLVALAALLGARFSNVSPTVMPLSELAAPFDMTLPAVLHHLKVLKAAALIERDKHGQRTYFPLQGDLMASARAWLDGNGLA